LIKEVSMKIESRLLFLAAGALMVFVPLLTALQNPPPVQSPLPIPIPGKITDKKLIPFEELKWAPMPEIDGAQEAVLWGEPAKGAHRILYMWPAGAKLAEHSHTHGDRGLVVTGTLTISIEGAAAKRLPPGSWFSIAGGVKHVTEVDSSAPCMFYIEREGPFDIVPVK
jgi:quercetin dioxygenase-like cupin family protein